MRIDFKFFTRYGSVLNDSLHGSDNVFASVSNISHPSSIPHLSLFPYTHTVQTHTRAHHLTVPMKVPFN